MSIVLDALDPADLRELAQAAGRYVELVPV